MEATLSDVKSDHFPTQISCQGFIVFAPMPTTDGALAAVNPPSGRVGHGCPGRTTEEMESPLNTDTCATLPGRYRVRPSRREGE